MTIARLLIVKDKGLSPHETIVSRKKDYQPTKKRASCDEARTEKTHFRNTDARSKHSETEIGAYGD